MSLSYNATVVIISIIIDNNIVFIDTEKSYKRLETIIALLYVFSV